MRAPPESFSPIIGAPTFIARSITLQILRAFVSDSDPPNTVIFRLRIARFVRMFTERSKRIRFETPHTVAGRSTSTSQFADCAASAIGYREVLALLEGKLADKDLAAEIAQNTRALVKKQRTWFRTQLPPAHRVVAADGLRNEAELFGD